MMTAAFIGGGENSKKSSVMHRSDQETRKTRASDGTSSSPTFTELLYAPLPVGMYVAPFLCGVLQLLVLCINLCVSVRGGACICDAPHHVALRRCSFLLLTAALIGGGGDTAENSNKKSSEMRRSDGGTSPTFMELLYAPVPIGMCACPAGMYLYLRRTHPTCLLPFLCCALSARPRW